MQEPNIILIGMMGSGKSTTGRLLAERLGWPFVDTDEELETDTGRKIPDIFREEGEAGFRRIEAETVAGVAKGNGHVIATGGGVVIDPANVQALQENGIIIFLSASPAELADRLQGDSQRPLLQESDLESRLNELLISRLPLYREAAALEVSTEGRAPMEVVEVIVQHMTKRLWMQVRGKRGSDNAESDDSTTGT